MLGSIQGKKRMNSEFESASDRLDKGPLRSRENRPNRGRFGLYAEGCGVFSLYLSPTHAPALLAGLGPWVNNRVLAILGNTPDQPNGIPLKDGGVITSGEAVLQLRAPTEAVVFNRVPTPQQLNAQLPSTLLACPQGALPESLGAELAIIVPDPQHLIVLTRDRSLLLHLLSRFLNRNQSGSFPRIEGVAEDEILEAMAPWAWRTVAHTEFDGVQQLAIETMDSESHSGQELRWVAPKSGGYWRSGWSW
jgi:hypothetical protein